MGLGPRADFNNLETSPHKRGGFAGGRVDRLTGDWQPGNAGPNLLHRLDGSMLRERARDLYINNPMARSAVRAYIANAIETGIRPTLSDAQTAGDRDQWLASWDKWCCYGADVTRQQHFYELQALWLTEVIVAGGCLVYYPQLSKAQSRDQNIPLAIQLIPEERMAQDFDLIMPGYPLESNVVVKGGVEIDTLTGRHLGYWVYPEHPNDLTYGNLIPIRLDIKDCTYSFFRDRIGQNRGYTLLASAIIWLWKLGYYLDNELMNSAIRSCWAAMVITASDTEDWADLSDDDGDGGGGITDFYGNRFERIQPGMLWRGQPGDTISGVGPNTPPGDASQWLQMIQRSIAVGMDLSYSEVMRDTGKSSFSAVRAEANADRKRYRPVQQFVIHHFCEPIVERFNAAAVLRGLAGFPGPAEYASEPEAYAPNWQPPG
jgi:lambda family phage portal protein